MNDSPKFIDIGKFIPKGQYFGTQFFLPASFKDDYDIEDPVPLGTGAFGTVFGLEALNRGGHIAVKRFNSPFQESKPERDAFDALHCLRELQILRELKHDNILKMIFAYIYTPDDCEDEHMRHIYLVTEYCGSNLCALLGQEKDENKQKFTLRHYQRMIYDILKAIKFLNSANIIHRDLKPDNLAINKDRKLTLLDFGYARVKAKNMTNEPGQRFYRAIEAFSLMEGEKPVYDEKVDIWSIGAILYEMLTGEIIFYTEKGDEWRRVLKILEVCGPIPEDLLNRIEDLATRESLRRNSLLYSRPRMDFLKQLEQQSKSWLMEEMEGLIDAAASFIDRALDYDPRTRLSVDEALAHPFLAQVREPATELTTTQSIVDYDELKLEESRELIRRIINQSGPQRSLRVRKHSSIPPQTSAPGKSRKRTEPCKS